MGNLFSSDPPRARRIKINVYRLNTDSRLVQTAEAMFGAKMYHSGVEIDGVEYAFGAGGGHADNWGVANDPGAENRIFVLIYFVPRKQNFCWNRKIFY